MSQPGPVIAVSIGDEAFVAQALRQAGLFPIIETDWPEACAAAVELDPAAVVMAAQDAPADALESLALLLADRQPYVPLIGIDFSADTLPENVIPFSMLGGHPERLVARLNSSLRVRSLHATLMRRLPGSQQMPSPNGETTRDASVLLIGRGATHPELSVALGEEMGVVGALSIEAAAKHLNTREINGIVLGDGFTERVTDAFLTVLSEDARFRNLPVIVASYHLASSYQLPNLEIVSGSAARVAAYALPLIRQNAFEVRLGRMLQSIEADGLLDPRTGLLTWEAFERDLTRAIRDALAQGSALSVTRFTFEAERTRVDGARILSRLMRKTDFGASCPDDLSILAVFTETEARAAQGIARRLASVMRHTTYRGQELQTGPDVATAALLPADTVDALLSRLRQGVRRAAS